MNIKWYMNRLKAMNHEEVLWRLSQKKLEKAERTAFSKDQVQISDSTFYEEMEDLIFDAYRLPVEEYTSLFCEKVPPRRTIKLLAGYAYETYRTKWHAGFQTQNDWPLTFSYDLSYKQKDEIGDARTNWELNRHFQFALLAKAYHDTKDEQYLTELSELFWDWNENNPFLWGISWTSVMEVAIRDINWMFALSFLIRSMKGETALSDEMQALFNGFAIGIINMTTYISAHFSQFSSANNHVIVEMCAVGLAGACFSYEPWTDLAISVLNHEVSRQNYHDGVNKEMSLHYQAFFMEAVGLYMMTLAKMKRNIPMNWKYTLRNMTNYVQSCRGYFGETMVFGDDDEGKILDLFHDENTYDYYGYVLRMMEAVLPKIPSATEEIKKSATCFPEGGITLMHSDDRRAFLGIDHGPLGFGTIAAHGHADALSFQLYLEGDCIFADPGTYIYHVDLESRNTFRKTCNHNTMTVLETDQSEMLGAFLWGKRAESNLREFDDCAKTLEAVQDGYAPIIHKRRFALEEKKLTITDSLLHVSTYGKIAPYLLNYTVGENVTVHMDDNTTASAITLQSKNGNTITVTVTNQTADDQIMNAKVTEGFVSPAYGELCPTKQLRYGGLTEQDITLITEISWE